MEKVDRQPNVSSALAPDAFIQSLHDQSDRYYHKHPFHVQMHAGKLTKKQVQGWIANRFYYQRSIPLKDAAILSNCPDPAVRQVWIQRILDQDGTEEGQGGREKWLCLGEAAGLSRQELLDNVHVLPGVRFAADAYVNFARTQPWIEAVAASLTELFVPDLMRERIAAFEKHYNWVDPQGLEYFKSRLTQAPHDSDHALELVKQYCTTADLQNRAHAALTFKFDVLWSMMDAIHSAYGVA